MPDDQKKQLEQQLWNIADTLRGKMDADGFRDYILGFIFYKYLSEKMLLYANDILKVDEINYLDIDENSKKGEKILEAVKANALDKLGYFLKPSELFSQLAKKGNSNIANEDQESNFILDELQKVLRDIEQSTMGADSEEDFDDLFGEIDLTSQKLGKTEKQKNEVVAKIFASLDKIDFQLANSKIDILGDAYEYLIGQFASGAGKKAGEFYTPQQVSKVLAKIVTTGKTKLKSVYDPACGSGSLLLRVAKETEVGMIYGQELNRTTYNLARMNMILHDMHFSKFDIKQDDTLENPQHLDRRFEAVVANPPFSAQWKADQLKLGDERFSQYGKLAPSSKADYAFIQHMIYHLADNGTMAVVAPHGVLFRGNSEGHIRRFLIEDRNYLDAVIGLPANIFYGTSIPTCILVFKKCRKPDDDIMFIDASREFAKVKNQNLLREEDIEKIIDTYRNRKELEKYSHVTTLDEIKENGFNLNIPRYVDTFEEEEPIDLAKVSKEIKEINKEMIEVDKEIKKYCEELGIDTPF